MSKRKNLSWRFWQWWVKHVSPAWLAVGLTVILVAPMLFISPIHGYADNGDFWRAILPNGIYPFAASNRSDYFNYVAPHYHIMQYFNENQTQVYSSQALFIQLALWLNRLFYSRTVFDLRFMGLVYFTLFLGTIWLLTTALTTPLRRFRSYLIAIMVVLVFADAGFTLYFNSFFAEPGGYIALLNATAAWLFIARMPKHRKLWVIGYFLNVLVFITNKQQNAPIALSFMVVTLGLLAYPAVRKRWPYLLIGISVVAASGVLTFALISKDFNDINLYQSFTNGVLLENSHPTGNIQQAGLNGQYALMRGDAYNPPGTAAVLPSAFYTKNHLLKKLSTSWIVMYYLKHPTQGVAMLDVAAKNQMIVQPTMVGDYTKSQGVKPKQQMHHNTTVTKLGQTFYPKRYAFGLMLAVTLIMVFMVGAFADWKTGEKEGPMRLALVLGLLSIVVFVPIVSIIGDGAADLAKHLFNVPVSLYLLFTILIADSLNGRLWHAWRKEQFDA
ncbi:hypothetical protein [Lacticaseibacillus sp. N501-2]|uniref:glycan biosynthesis hexose transferase WsfD n=1 Tax=Lacticaseibacillus salsurae TaxID=3367729 RepID=UPI0038B405B6